MGLDRIADIAGWGTLLPTSARVIRFCITGAVFDQVPYERLL